MLSSAAQNPAFPHGVTPDILEVPERNFHLTAIAGPDRRVPYIDAAPKMVRNL